MGSTTQTMFLTIATGIAKKLLISAAAAAATHGWISSNQTEMFVSVGIGALGVLWSIWNDYGKAIVLSQLEVLKAKSLAQAAKLRDAGVSPVTVSQIADQNPTLTNASVAKTLTTLPKPIQDNVAA